MKVVSYWRQFHKLASVQIIALIPIVAAIRVESESLREILPPEQYAKLNAALAICALVARLIQQQKVTK